MLKSLPGAMNGQQNRIRFFIAGQIYDQEKGEISQNLVDIFLDKRNKFAEEVEDESEESTKAKVPGPGGKKGLGVPENKALHLQS
jgi:hypothetical protein